MSPERPKSAQEIIKEELGEIARPIRNLIRILGMRSVSGRELPEITSAAEEKELAQADNVVDQFQIQIAEGGDSVEENIRRQRALRQLNISLALFGLFRTKSDKLIREFFEKHGISDYSKLSHVEAMKEENSPLNRAIVGALAPIGKPGEKNDFIAQNKGNLNFNRLAKRVVQWHGGDKNKENRNLVRQILMAMVDTFADEYEASPELQAFIDEVTAAMTKAQQKEFKRSKEDTSDRTKYLESLFIAHAPELKTRLEELFSLKSLDSRRWFALLQTAEGKELADHLGIDVDSSTKAMAEKYLGTNLEQTLGKITRAVRDAEDISEIAADIEKLKNAIPGIERALRTVSEESSKASDITLVSDAIADIEEAIAEGEPIEAIEADLEDLKKMLNGAEEEVLEFLFNTALGRKLARETGVKKEALRAAANEKVSDLLRTLLVEFPEGSGASSFQGFLENVAIARNKNPMGDYEAILLEGNKAYEEHKNQTDPEFWVKLQTLLENSSSSQAADEQVEEVLAELKQNNQYNAAIELYDLLAKVVQNRLEIKIRGKEGKELREAMQTCGTAYGDTGEGFKRDICVNIPGVSLTDCDFKTAEPEFDFEKLMELYAEGVEDPRLIQDLREEVISQIIEPIMVELGIPIRRDASFDENNTEIAKHYISQADFNMAKDLKKGLEALMNNPEVKLKERKEEEKKPEEEEKPELTNEMRKAVMRAIAPNAKKMDAIEARRRKKEGQAANAEKKTAKKTEETES